MGLPSKKKVNWFETLNRRSRLRSATALPIRSVPNPSPEQPIEMVVLDTDSDEEERNVEIMDESSHKASADEGSNVEIMEDSSCKATASTSARASASYDKQCHLPSSSSEVSQESTLQKVIHSNDPDSAEEEVTRDTYQKQPPVVEGPFTDPDYKFFLDNVTTEGMSFVFHTVVDGVPFTVRYEDEEDYAGEGEVIQAEPKRTPSTGPEKGIKKNNKRRSGVRKRREEIYNTTSSSEVVCERPSPVGEILLDESYQVFLKHVKERDGSMVLVLENGVSISYEKEYDEVKSNKRKSRYEKEVKSNKGKSKDVAVDDEKKGKKGNQKHEKEVVVKEEPVDLDDGDDDVRECDFSNKKQKMCFSPLDAPPFAETSTPAYQDDILEESITFSVTSTFKERLEATIQEPFSKKDLEELLKFANNRSPVLKYKHLRHDSIPYSTDKLARSYLDQHPDLAAKLAHADDKERLCLLRGLRFWYENLSHDGAFKPWKSGSLQECDPQSPTRGA